MHLRQLAYFRAVAEHGSLAAASDALHVAQPPSSVAIKQLDTVHHRCLEAIAQRKKLIVSALASRAAQDRNSALAVEQRCQAIELMLRRGHDWRSRSNR